jgi:sodium-dependent dicarboxylate transporter 2/3/5
MLVQSGLTNLLVQKMIIKSQGHMPRIILYILISGALLSFFIPNAVSVLILLPVIKQIEIQIKTIQLNEHQYQKMVTALGLSAIYGANIGGMGSLVGSPANLILIGALDFLGETYQASITFLNWFLWSIPLVVCFLISAFCMIRFFALPTCSTLLYCNVSEQNQLNNQQKRSLHLFILFVIFWILHSIGDQTFCDYQFAQSCICLAFMLFFSYRLYQQRLLSFKQLICGIPLRGSMVLILFVCIMMIVRYFHLDQWAALYFNQTLPIMDSSIGLVVWVTGISILLTEFLSNTIVSTALFPIVYQTAQMNDIMPLILMISVSVASTCAFMTPIATPCNAFVYGEIKEIRLGTMMICGLALNVLCVICVAIWIPLSIPLIYY